jgi:hypothetical protein
MLPSLRHVAPQLVVSGLLPVIVYPIVRAHVSTDVEALVIVAMLPFGDVVFERSHRHRVEPIGLLSLSGILLSVLVATCLHGDATVLKVRESAVSALFGIVCLASLVAPRPLLFYVSRAFASGGDPRQSEAFDEDWSLPTVPRRFRTATAVWGVGLVSEATLRCVLAVTLPTEAFLVTTQFLSWAVYGTLMWWTFAYIRSSKRAVKQLLAQPSTGALASPHGPTALG